VTRLLVATRSPGKAREFRDLLAPFGLDVVFPDDIGLAETPVERSLECFDTLADNAVAKACWFARETGLPTLADDSGLEVDALDGAPGVRSKRFAGLDGADVGAVSAANIDLLLERLRGIPPERRTARYRSVVALAWPSPMARPPQAVTAEGVTGGRIVEAPVGSGGFGYDPVFFSTELGKTFGQASIGEKAAVSHRARALAGLASVLRAPAR
jgi:XTP/dITP diphosphohydrolase